MKKDDSSVYFSKTVYIKEWGAGMAQWWERSPPTNVICGLSLLLVLFSAPREIKLFDLIWVNFTAAFLLLPVHCIYHIHIWVKTLQSTRKSFYLDCRYLVDLDYQGDPAWECLVHQKDWLLKLLANCHEDHKSKGKNGLDKLIIR